MKITINFSTDLDAYGTDDAAYIGAYQEAVVEAVREEYPDAEVDSTYRELMGSVSVEGHESDEQYDEIQETVEYHIQKVFADQSFTV